MRRLLLAVAVAVLSAAPAAAQTAEEIVAKFIKTTGGMERIQAVKTLRRTGKFKGGGGFEATVVEENKRPNMVRQEFSLQGMTQINAYDGRLGWKIEPWQGKKDVEPLGEEELKEIVEASDLDGPLVNYREKGNKVEYAGLEPVEGTDAHKLKVTLANGDVRFYYMDTDYFVPIKIDTKRMIRGAEREYETILGDYKEVNGWYLPHSVESGVKGSPNKQSITYEKIEANLALEDGRFRAPAAPGPQAPAASPPDASNQQGKPTEETKPRPKQEEAPKPPRKAAAGSR